MLTAPMGDGKEFEGQEEVDGPHGRWRGIGVTGGCRRSSWEMARNWSDRRKSTVLMGDGEELE